MKTKMIPVQCEPVCQLKEYDSVTWTQVPGTGRLVGAFYHKLDIASNAVNELWAIDLNEDVNEEVTVRLRPEGERQQLQQLTHQPNRNSLYQASGSASGFGSATTSAAAAAAFESMEVDEGDVKEGLKSRSSKAKCDSSSSNEPASLKIVTARAVCLDTRRPTFPFKRALLCASSTDVWVMPSRYRKGGEPPDEALRRMAANQAEAEAEAAATAAAAAATVPPRNNDGQMPQQQQQQQQSFRQASIEGSDRLNRACQITLYRVPTTVPRLHELARGAFFAYSPRFLHLPDFRCPHRSDLNSSLAVLQLPASERPQRAVTRHFDLISSRLKQLYPQYDLRHFRFTDYP